MELICSNCRYKKRCALGTEDAVKEAIAKNDELLRNISTADKPRFEDEENVEWNFKEKLDMFFDVMSVLYAIPMNGYFPENDASEEKLAAYRFFHGYRHFSSEQCIRQAQMRILTLGRASCGFVGPYSSGKSSYLNAEVFGGDLLPVGVNATTSIPTYIFSGRRDQLVLENMRGNIWVSSNFDALRQLSHSTKPKGCPLQFQWDAVIKRLFCFSSKLKHNRELVYVDLPGYSASTDDNRSMKEALEGCDKVVYFIPVKNGDLSETDIAYLKAISGKDVMIVLSKVDKMSPSDCKKVYNQVKGTLQDNGIKIEGIVLYTNRKETFASDADFFKKLKNHRDKLNEFILDTSAKENDMALSNAMMQHYVNGFIEHEKGISSSLGSVEELFDGFVGSRKLDKAFFDSWKNINKSVADSSGNYVDSHFFTANTVRVGDYLTANQERIYNYFKSDTYDSEFNTSYQLCLYGYTMYFLYKTAFYTQLYGRADSNYTEACEAIDGVEKVHDAVRKHLDLIFDAAKNFFNYHKQLSISIVQDAQLAFRLVEEAYGKLLNYVKNYEKRWYEK